MRFTDLNVTCCPDLQNKESVILTQVEANKVRLPKSKAWVDKVLNKTSEEGVYELKLYGQEKIYTLAVKIPLQGAALKSANEQYEALMAAYEANKAMLKDKKAMYEQRAAFRRSLRVQSFGIYNYDILWKRPDMVPIYANFNFGLMPDELLTNISVFLITGDNRTVIDFPHSDWKKFRFSPSADNKLVAVLPGNKVAFFTKSDFEAAKEDIVAAAGTDYTFDMTIEEETMDSMDDLQAIIDKASI